MLLDTMNLLIGQKKVVENPHHTDVRDSVRSLLSFSAEVRLNRSDGGWIRAYWTSALGIQLEYFESNSGIRYESARPFVGKRNTMALLSSYAKGQNGWREMVRWSKKSRKLSITNLVRNVTWHSRIGSILLVMFLLVGELGVFDSHRLIASIHPDINAELAARGLIPGVLGLGGMSWTLTDYMYADEVIDSQHWLSDYSPHEAFFGSFMILFFGIVVIAVALTG